MRILYYLEAGNETIEVSDSGKRRINQPAKKVFEALCLEEVSTLKGRIEAARALFGYKYNVPIFVNPALLLYKIGDGSKYWLNYFEVASVLNSGGGTDFLFKNGEVLKTKASYRSSVQAHRRAQRISER